MSFEKIMTDIKHRKFAPVYFLCGEEPFFIDKISDAIEHHALDENEKAFNQTIIYGRDADINSVISECRSFPMMAEKRVVILKETQNFKGTEFEKLEPYLKNHTDSTILVICYKYGKFDKRKSFWKTLTSKPEFIAFESAKLYDNKVPQWIDNYANQIGLSISKDGNQFLFEHVGNNLEMLATEMDKLKAILPAGKVVDKYVVMDQVGVSHDFNIWELQKALAEKNFVRTMKIADYFKQNPKDHNIIPTIISLYNFFSQLYLMQYLIKRLNYSQESALKKIGANYFNIDNFKAAEKNYLPKKVKSILHLLHEYDLRSKGVNESGTNSEDLQREMLLKIIL